VKKQSFFSTLQKVGQSLMTPVSVLPAAGLLVALGRLLQSASLSEGAESNPWLMGLGKVFFSGGLAIFEQLPVVFAVGVAIGFTGGAGVAGLAAVVGYFTMTSVMNVVGELRHLDMAINTGVFGGIFIGLLCARLYNRFHQVKLHPVFGFFAGKRFVPIVTAASAILVGLGFSFLWPPIQNGIHSFGMSIMDSTFGPAFYAAGKRMLIPVGLHHVFYPPFLFQFGDFLASSGQLVHGDSARYFAGDPTAGRFMASEFPLMLFGLPAAAFAMYLRAKPAQRKAVGGIMLTAALTSIITGITEPIEFAFIFVAPVLYVFHVVAAFLAGSLTGFFDIHLGYTFSASAIDYALGYFNQKNSSYLFLVIGPLIALLYFSVFYFAIGFLNLKTPGREDDLAMDGVKTDANETSTRALNILKAIGGASNIVALDACITRLRLSVTNSKLLNKAKLKEIGAAGILDAGNGDFQIVFGVESDQIKEEIRSLIKNTPAVTDSKSIQILLAGMNGKLVPLENVPDATFSEKILGDGFAIEPSDGLVCSPVDGTVKTLFRTNHALGIETQSGLEILIHIGLDTVKLEGQGFKSHVKAGDTVKAGQELIEFDLAFIKANAKSSISPIVITNMDKVEGLRVLKTGAIQAKEALLEIKLKH